MSQNNLAIILSGGTGTRFDTKLPKQFHRLNDKYIIEISVNKFLETKLFQKIVVVSSLEYFDLTKKILNFKNVEIVLGGKTRQGSAYNALRESKKYKIENVLIHDAARPLVSISLIKKITKGIQRLKCLVPSINVNDSLRKVDRQYKDINRENVKIIQTPQAFKFIEIMKAHEKFKYDNLTDDSIILAKNGIKINQIKGELTNFKITTKDDLKLANKVEKTMNKQIIKVGNGFDVHEFESGDYLILFGIKVPFNKKLKGHSDADVGLHAITDAILGSIGEGDIGEHFPPTENKWRNKDSEFFLQHTKKLMKIKGYKINNIDVTLICEKPKINIYKKKFKKNVSKILEIEISDINIKATTTEKLGFLGRGEGIACQAIATVAKNEN